MKTVFIKTIKKKVTKMGEPSYTSGVHKLKGKAPNFSKKPRVTSNIGKLKSLYKQ